ncbi:hypothetical protein PoB_003175800 [Plakobranchus ocellatus]|uniref:Uncharacterized protein n=1 Tax=Plakobranchus ocellatus TaxID=259542 RepID=A0AAV4AEM1_9GAST|nr:hypothetical protein PoB_003175800 [Plakobranchus ocellatus]
MTRVCVKQSRKFAPVLIGTAPSPPCRTTLSFGIDRTKNTSVALTGKQLEVASVTFEIREKTKNNLVQQGDYAPDPPHPKRDAGDLWEGEVFRVGYRVRMLQDTVDSVQ